MESPSALFDLFSPVSATPEVGPLCHALLHSRSGKRVGWFLPDSAETLPLEILCLRVQVTPLDIKELQATWAIRGLVLTHAEDPPHTQAKTIAASSSSRLQSNGPHHSMCYRRVGYFELDCELKGTSVGSEFSGRDEIVARRVFLTSPGKERLRS